MEYGFFDEKNREYVIERVDVPVSWTNYLGVEDTCAVINQTAGGYMFHKSPEYHRMTRFRGNAVPMDRPGFDLYLRDTQTKDYWSATWQPVGKPLDQVNYSCCHGLSYSRYFSRYAGIETEMRLTIPLGEDVLLWDFTLKNTGSQTRLLQLFSFCEFSFHGVASDNQNFQMSMYCSGADYQDGVIEQRMFYEPGKEQYFTASFQPDSYDTLRDSFLGIYHTEQNPKVVIEGQCTGSAEEGNNHCGSFQKNLELEPGASVRLIFMLGSGNRKEGVRIREKYTNLNRVDQSYRELRDYWEAKLNCLQIQTPDKGMNVLTNTWTLYQAEINVIFSRFASFIEVGGRTGLGYRDTAQDAMCVPHSNPEKCRRRLLQLLRALTTRGYGIHLFEPEWFDSDAEPEYADSPTVIPTAKKDHLHKIEQACSDDALWLVPSIVEYVKETGEVEFLKEKVSYADGGEDTVYEHMKRILDFSYEQVGKTGICKGLRADWNDCLNLGGGESALVTFLHYWAISNLLELAGHLQVKSGDWDISEDIKKYKDMRVQVKKASEQLWDNEWYIRGITKNGKLIGTIGDEEGKIHLESNAWAVLSGAANWKKGATAMDSVEKWLYTPYGLQLNAPAYTKRDDDIGFVTRVCPGLKENASIFSHPNPWAWAAECVLGRGDKAVKFYDALCPYYQNDKIEIREAEPYSYCQFIMGRDHTYYGRARHPFMTGSGGWAYFAVTHYILGIRPGMDKLLIDPCIPGEWKEFTVKRRWRGAEYQIRVENPDGVMKGVRSVFMDGKEVLEIPPMKKGTVHQITVCMGGKKDD